MNFFFCGLCMKFFFLAQFSSHELFLFFAQATPPITFLMVRHCEVTNHQIMTSKRGGDYWCQHTRRGSKETRAQTVRHNTSYISYNFFCTHSTVHYHSCYTGRFLGKIEKYTFSEKILCSNVDKTATLKKNIYLGFK